MRFRMPQFCQPASGVSTQYTDAAVRPQDDPYRYLNGKWLDRFEIPPDKAQYGAFTLIDDQTQEQVRAIVESLAAARCCDPARDAAEPDADSRKIADLYASFIDEPRLEALGPTPLE